MDGNLLIKLLTQFDEKLSALEKRITDLDYEIKYAQLAKGLREHSALLQKHVFFEPIMTFFVHTYNGEKLFPRAIESILMQETSYKYKIHIIDDCSNDATVAIAKEYEKLYPDRVEVTVNKYNVYSTEGETLFTNTLKFIKTKYWMCLNQDDYWISRDRLQRTLDFLELHPDIMLYAANLYIKNGSELTVACRHKSKNFYFGFCDYPHPLGILMQTSSVIYRNYFTADLIESLYSFVKENKTFITGDTFRNLLALSHGKGFYDVSADSVYEWNCEGKWSSLNYAQQEFLNFKNFCSMYSYFSEKVHKDHLLDMVNYYKEIVINNKKMLTKDELKEFQCVLKDIVDKSNG